MTRATGTAPAGYPELRCRIRIDTDADRESVLAALDEADRHSPWRDNFSRAVPLVRTVEWV